MRRAPAVLLVAALLSLGSVSLPGCVMVAPRGHARVWVPGYWVPPHVWVGGHWRDR